ncbi:hypothetical protein WBP_0891 [Wolbachia endosymbiont of Brugia pahangi]|nr:hypothetical protein WBP_0891 [Wolbachia endosymbiont of Brugia pahangi]
MSFLSAPFVGSSNMESIASGDLLISFSSVFKENSPCFMFLKCYITLLFTSYGANKSSNRRFKKEGSD